MAGMSVDGLVSGLDTTTLINQLIQAEAAPQTALKSRLAAAQTAASAYRTVNSSFAAVRTAAEAVTASTLWTSAKATSSAASVAVAAGANPPTGSLSFKVVEVAATHSAASSTRWTSATTAAGLTTIDVRTADNSTSRGTITLDGTESLTQVAAKINAATTLNLSAAVVQVRPNEYALQVTSTKSGAAAGFTLAGNETFKTTTPGKDAELKIGSTADAYSVYSATNTFEGVLPGATLTVSQPEALPVTVSVVADPEAVAAKVGALVDAVNSALSTVKTYTSSAPGSTAALKGEFALTSLSGELLNAVASAVAKDDGSDVSPATAGFQLTRDGKITFDKTKFLAALKDDPALAQRIVSGAPATKGGDGIAGTGDDEPAVQGLADRLQAVAKRASDTTTGSLTALAKGKDSIAEDIKDRIEAWDLRLAARKELLSRQFSAMETALSSLQNQSSWLAGQLNALPSA